MTKTRDIAVSSSSSSGDDPVIHLTNGGRYVVPPSYLGRTKFRLTIGEKQYARIVLNGDSFEMGELSGRLTWDFDNAHHSQHSFYAVGETTSQLSGDKEYLIEYRGPGQGVDNFLFNISFSAGLSSSSSLSTQEMSSSSVSSQSSASSRSSSTEIGTSSSSTSSLNSSSSQSSQSSTSSSSQSSSSSSGNNGYQEMRFLFEGVNTTPVWCLAERSGTVYAGTGPFGVVLQSTDLASWTTFKTLTDCHVRSMIVWANALFMGTEPLGRIYVHNFSSSAFYLFVETEDQVVTSFASFDGKLYAGTSPAGIIYAFDGAIWKKAYKAYGGINSMRVYNNKLYVLANRTETIPVFDGQNWNVIKIKDMLVQKPNTKELLQNHTVASYRNTTTPPFSFDDQNPLEVVRMESISEMISAGVLTQEDRFAVLPPRPETSLKSAATDEKAGLILGGSNGQVFVYDQAEMTLRQKFGCDGKNVNAIINLSPGENIVAIGNELFVMKGVQD